MRNLKGVDTGKPAGVCLAVGCSKKAVYRSKNGRRNKGGMDVGYCAAHKDFARPSEGDRRIDDTAKWIGECAYSITNDYR